MFLQQLSIIQLEQFSGLLRLVVLRLVVERVGMVKQQTCGFIDWLLSFFSHFKLNYNNHQPIIPMLKILSNKIPTLLSSNLSRQCISGISVYEGISPALLATMSLSQGIKGNTNNELINSLIKNNIISNKVLQSSMRKYDRKEFIVNDGKQINFYENKPYKISGGHNMTDIFTHAVVLQQICYYLEEIGKIGKKSGIRVLDIGTGHGYLAFVLATLLPKLGFTQTSILAVDSSAAVINYAKKIQQKYISSGDHPEANTVQFHERSVQNILDNPTIYNIIIGGFYMPPKFSEGLINKMDKDHGFGVWAEDSSSGQSLYSIRKKQGKVVKSQIMSTMFSMPTVKTTVSNYFHDQSPQNEVRQSTKQTPIQTQASEVNEQKLREHLQSLKKQAKQKQKQQLKQKLKILITQHSVKLNRKLSLDQMKTIKEIDDILQKLNKR